MLTATVIMTGQASLGLVGVANAATPVNGTLAVSASPAFQTVGSSSTITTTYTAGTGTASQTAAAGAQSITLTASGSATFTSGSGAGTNTTTCTTTTPGAAPTAGDGGSCSVTLVDQVSEKVTVTATDNTDRTVPAAQTTVNYSGLHFTNCSATGVNTTANCVTQAAAGQNQTGSVTYLQDGAGAAGVNVQIDVASTGAGTPKFTATQPAGTAFFSDTRVICTTDSAGKCSYTYIDNTQNDTLTFTAQTTGNTGSYPPSSAQERVNIVPSTTPGRLVESGSTLIQPDAGGSGAGNAQPGDAIQKTYTLYSTCTTGAGAATCQGTALAGVPVTLSVDHGFFTPNCTGAATTTNYANCSFNTTPAAGTKVGDLKSSGTTTTATTDNSGQFTVTIGIAKDAGFNDDGLVSAVVSGVAQGSSATLPATNPGNGTAGQDCTANPGNGGCATATTWSTKNQPLNGGTIGFRSIDGSDISAATNNVPDNQTRTFVVEATDQFGNLTNLGGGATSVTLTQTGAGTLLRCTGYTGGNNCTTKTGGTTTTNGSGATTTTFTNVVPAYTAAFTSNGGTTQDRFIAQGGPGNNSGNGTDGTQTDTATWTAPVTTFNTYSGGTNLVPAVATYATSTATKTATLVINFYNQAAQPVVTFSTTPGNSVAVGTAVTVSATVKDQFGNPIQGANVQFIRSGSNDSSCNPSYPNGYQQGTNAQGKAGFSFTCNSAGTANVSIIVTDNSGVELARGTQSVTFTGGTTPPPANGAPSVSLSVAAINPGQPASLIVTGTPGDVVNVFAKTAPATSFTEARHGLTIPASGRLGVPITPRRNTQLFASNAAGASNTVTLYVRPAIALHASVSGKSATFTGSIVPGVSGSRVRLFSVSGGVLKFQGETFTTSGGAFAFPAKSFAVRAGQTVQFLAQTTTNANNLSGQSPRINVTFH